MDIIHKLQTQNEKKLIFGYLLRKNNMKCEFYMCENSDNKPFNKSKCTKVHTDVENNEHMYICSDCSEKYIDKDGYIFTCTECKDLFEVQYSVWPCQCNDGSCPTLCDSCQEKTGLIKSCDCGVFCDKHKHECVCARV